ncbi:sporulation protein [Geomonas limicola]|uniref:Sporulation protein n=1 Tax=Geomonas limicola TaxID=2740186 RepID=A0A6V8NDV5_9BACT|nr:sporulation protein [Geomonas limicola]
MILAFVVFACVVGALVVKKYQTAHRKAEQPQQTAPAPAATRVVNLFFASPDGDRLVREGREVEIEEETEADIESVVDELVRGPLGELGPTLPPNTRILGVQLKGDQAFIDFGPELQQGLPEGSSAELVAAYSLVDTVTANFPQVKKVQILVNGVAVETLKGHLDIRYPLVPDYSLEQPAEGDKGAGAAEPKGEKGGKPGKAGKGEKAGK